MPTRPAHHRRGFFTGAALATVALLLASGCPGELENPEIFGDIEDIDCIAFTEQYIQQSCSIGGCHDAGTRAGDLALVGGNIGAALVDEPGSAACPGDLIDSSDPMQSLMVTKLLNDPPCGARMPLSLRAPDDLEVNCMMEWVVEQIGPP